jgi:hypothetical protein
MSYSTIYDMRTAHVLTDGVQSQAMCDATINTARYLARERKHSVIVEDRDRGMLPSSGHVWHTPHWWGAPSWEQEE